MRTLEFLSHLNPDQTLTVPSAVADEIRGEQSLRVVLVVPDTDDDRSWAELTAEQFLRGYSEGDAIYDQLSAR